MRNIRRMVKVLIIWSVLVIFSVSFSEAAVGLSTKFGFVIVENLQPGRTYNIRKLIGLPLRVVNTGDKKVELKIELNKPPTDQPGMVKKGFEPIPDLSWVKLSRDYFVVDPGKSAVSDVIITIPDDDKYLGKRYQVDIWSHTVGKSFMAAGLGSTLRFTIAYRRMSKKEEKALENYDEIAKEIDFQMLPHSMEIDSVPLGKEIDLSKRYNTTLKIINPNNQKFTYKLSCVKAWHTAMGVISGYEDAPDPRFLSFNPEVVEVSSLSIKEVKMTIMIPKDKKYSRKKYQFIISAEVLNQPIIYQIYSRLFVHTK